MPYEYADYSQSCQRLEAAGQQLIDSLRDEVDRSIAIQDVESAAHEDSNRDAVLGFGPSRDELRGSEGNRPNGDDMLSGLLLELHSANVLLASGIALNEHGGGSNTQLLERSLAEVGNSRSIVTRVLVERAELRFAPTAGVKSSTLEGAKTTFRDNADGVLKAIVEEAASVVNAVFEQLKKLDGGKILEGIEKLGESFRGVAAAGRLIRQGMEKLKRVFEALTKIFGSELLAGVKKKVMDIWKKFESGQATRDLLTWVLDVEQAQARIANALAQDGIGPDGVDGASNSLPTLLEKCKGNMKLLRSLVSAIVLGAAIISALSLAAPWLPLALIGLYAAVLGAALLVGMDYCDSGRVLNWVHGVGQIAGGIRPAGG